MSDVQGRRRRRGERGPDKKPRKGSPLQAAVTAGVAPAVVGESKRLPAKRLAVQLLAAGKRAKDVGVELGVSDRTITRWLADPRFAGAVAEEQAAILAAGRRHLAGNAEVLCRRLVRLSKSASKEDMAKVKATTEGLDRIGITRREVLEVVTDPDEGMSDEDIQRELLKIAKRLG